MPGFDFGLFAPHTSEAAFRRARRVWYFLLPERPNP